MNDTLSISDASPTTATDGLTTRGGNMLRKLGWLGFWFFLAKGLVWLLGAGLLLKLWH